MTTLTTARNARTLSKSFIPVALALLISASLFTDATAQIENAPNATSGIVEFLESNCYGCHDEFEKKGGLDLSSLPFASGDASSMKLWSMALDRVRSGEMPPKEDFELDKHERRRFLEAFETFMHKESEAQQTRFGRVRARRLNRTEFENTLHDLLGIDIPISSILPEDSSQDGFSNIASAQQISYHLLQKYLEGIDLALDESFARAERAPTPLVREFSPTDVSWNPSTRENGRGPHLHHGRALSFLTSGNFQGRLWPTAVDESGWYRITIRAKAHRAPKGRGVWTQVRTGVAAATAPTLHWAGFFEATDEAKDFSMDAWIQAGHRLEVQPGDQTLRTVAVKQLNNPQIFESDVPAVAMEHIRIERIHKGLDPLSLRKRLFDDLPLKDGRLESLDTQKDLQRLMVRFASLAYRRTVTDAQIRPHLEFASSRLQSGSSLRDSLQIGIQIDPKFSTVPLFHRIEWPIG